MPSASLHAAVNIRGVNVCLNIYFRMSQIEKVLLKHSHFFLFGLQRCVDDPCPQDTYHPFTSNVALIATSSVSSRKHRLPSELIGGDGL